MNQNQNMEDLKHIRNLMERSSKFLSLSGFSGVAAGIIALIGAAVAHCCILKRSVIRSDGYTQSTDGSFMTDVRVQMAILAFGVLVCAIGVAWYFSSRKARKTGTRLWSPTARRTLYHFLVPLVTGGIFCVALMVDNHMHLIGSATLIFYGLSLVNSGKFTVDEIHYLGLSEIVLGLLAAFFAGYGLIFWALGFGVLHIVYGMRMYYKYDRK